MNWSDAYETKFYSAASNLLYNDSPGRGVQRSSFSGDAAPRIPDTCKFNELKDESKQPAQEPEMQTESNIYENIVTFEADNTGSPVETPPKCQQIYRYLNGISQPQSYHCPLISKQHACKTESLSSPSSASTGHEQGQTSHPSAFPFHGNKHTGQSEPPRDHVYCSSLESLASTYQSKSQQDRCPISYKPYGPDHSYKGGGWKSSSPTTTVQSETSITTPKQGGVRILDGCLVSHIKICGSCRQFNESLGRRPEDENMYENTPNHRREEQKGVCSTPRMYTTRMNQHEGIARETTIDGDQHFIKPKCKQRNSGRINTNYPNCGNSNQNITCNNDSYWCSPAERVFPSQVTVEHKAPQVLLKPVHLTPQMLLKKDLDIPMIHSDNVCCKLETYYHSIDPKDSWNRSHDSLHNCGEYKGVRDHPSDITTAQRIHEQTSSDTFCTKQESSGEVIPSALPGPQSRERPQNLRPDDHTWHTLSNNHTQLGQPQEQTQHGQPSGHTQHGQPREQTQCGQPGGQTQHGQPGGHTQHGQLTEYKQDGEPNECTQLWHLQGATQSRTVENFPNDWQGADRVRALATIFDKRAQKEAQIKEREKILELKNRKLRASHSKLMS